MIGKFTIGLGTNTSLAGGFFTAANSHFSKEDHQRATCESGRGLNRQESVKTLVENGPGAIEKLRAHGVSLADSGIGYRIDRPAGSPQLGGVLLIKALAERLKRSSIKLLPGLAIFDLIVEEGKAEGAFGFLRDGKPCLIRSRAVILAAGGAGAVYRRNDNQKGILGDGYALALRAGLPLYDLEFVQFYPLALAEPSLSTLPLFPPFPNEMKLFHEGKENLLEKLGIREDLNRTIRTQRDRLSMAIYEASQQSDVYCDLTHVPTEQWDHYPLNFLRKSKFLFRERPFLIAPAVHFFMGGVETDQHGMTALPGLFAAGEVVWGIHGANRHGGNALTECTVFGALAGQSAAEYARAQENRNIQSVSPDVWQRRGEKRAKEYLRRKRGPFDHPRDLLKDLKNLAWKYAGPIREESSLKEGLVRLASEEKKIEKIYPATLTDLFKKRDLENVALLLQAILKGSLFRTESRGAFFRKDFPGQDDLNWKRNTCYRLEGGEIQVSHRSTVDS